MHQWSRAPINSNKVHVLKLSDIRGWSMLCEDAGKTSAGCRCNFHTVNSYVKALGPLTVFTEWAMVVVSVCTLSVAFRELYRNGSYFQKKRKKFSQNFPVL